MNNTKTTLTIVAIFMAATLVVGTFAVTTTTATTQTAFAFSKNKKGGDENSKNGNTITALKCENKGSASGFDTATNQECENLICTHPGENATCVYEGAAAAVQQGSSHACPTGFTLSQGRCIAPVTYTCQPDTVLDPSSGVVYRAILDQSIGLCTVTGFIFPIAAACTQIGGNLVQLAPTVGQCTFPATANCPGGITATGRQCITKPGQGNQP